VGVGDEAVSAVAEGLEEGVVEADPEGVAEAPAEQEAEVGTGTPLA